MCVDTSQSSSFLYGWGRVSGAFQMARHCTIVSRFVTNLMARFTIYEFLTFW